MLAAMNLAHFLRIQAHANALANHRLHTAMAALAVEEFHATRTSFFPSLAATLNHILAVDEYYIGALQGDSDLAARYGRFVAATGLPELAERQRRSDARLVAFCSRLDEAGCAAQVAMERGEGRIQRDQAAHVLAHLFMHQTHHRGQAHAMLSGTSVKPPQLDEFLMPSEASLRLQDMAALGWDEAAVYGTSHRG
jgi:uncharacterized damage-inducible protein DinB